ncbi:MAG: hypothetical protein M1819_006265 [Sarea resinae]|nr:MAG: hypothetical protein M1819_006265 [Sarea resinae]
MFNKPFRPPLINRSAGTSPDIGRTDSSSSAKRRRVNGPEKTRDIHAPSQKPSRSGFAPFSSLTRKPLLSIHNSAAFYEASEDTGDGAEAYYAVLWRKPTAKKHKTWDGDGILSIRGGFAHLHDVSGRDMGRVNFDSPLLPGSTLSVSGKEVEVDSVITKRDYLAGRPFLNVPSSSPNISKSTMREEIPIALRVQDEDNKRSNPSTEKSVEHGSLKKVLNVSAPKTVAASSRFKNPMLANTVMPKGPSAAPTPRHDPHKPGALLMLRPKSLPKGKQIVDVVVDPILSRHLREHQREGVKFLYECVMGLRPFAGEGAILADEMGLGKTLQTITLLWTLLKQNPVYEAAPVIKKALIVCPATLVDNWRKEFRKWLGNERIGVFVADGTRTRLSDFTKGKSYNVMIIGYERLRNVQEELQGDLGIDIVIADEGHRLKSAKNKSALAIKSLNTERRVILSGTPIQNDLGEFYFTVDFVNPGLLGKYSSFKKEFEDPIVKSRDSASEKDIEKGNARSKELASLTGMFILRRTADILSQYLPSKTEYVLFCRPTAAQVAVYRNVLVAPGFGSIIGSPEASLQLITILKKVCNSPSLLKGKAEGPTKPAIADLLSGLPAGALRSPAESGKFRVLDNLLYYLRTTTEEKVVIVSNYTSTLDMLATLLTSLSYPYLRLDGAIPSAKRQDLVDTFNRTPASECFAFLLSAKSGGTGLNLIGASRLVLYDIDWNPATDLQAMARIHRDGQKRECKIYRLLTRGALDEKIYQRQLTKRGLADSVMENKVSSSSFSREELRDLFSLDETSSCQTHDLLGCHCGSRGDLPPSSSSALTSLPGAGGRGRSVTIDLTQSSDISTSPRSASVVTSDDQDEDEEDEDSDDTLPAVFTLTRSDFKQKPNPKASLTKASELHIEAQERSIGAEAQAARTKAQASKMASLMGYVHLDTSRFSGSFPKADGDDRLEGEADALQKNKGRTVIDDDDVLRQVLCDEANRISFLFAKTSK